MSTPSSTTAYAIDVAHDRYPFCIVWTPIPLITWLLPFVGHMGICDSHGVIHDFAGPYFISRDNMAFGRPVKYWCLHPSQTRTLDLLRGGNGEGRRADTLAVPSSSLGLEEHNEEISSSQKRRGIDEKEEGVEVGIAPTRNATPPPATVAAPLTTADMWDAGVYRAAEMYRKMNYNFFCNNCHSFVGTALEQMELISLNNPHSYSNVNVSPYGTARVGGGGGGTSVAGALSSISTSSSLVPRGKEGVGSSATVGVGASVGMGVVAPRGPSSGSSSPNTLSQIGPVGSQQQPTPLRTIDVNRRAIVGDTVIQLKTWNMVTIGAQIFFFGKYVSFGKFLLAHLPFFLIVAIIVSAGYWGSAL